VASAETSSILATSLLLGLMLMSPPPDRCFHGLGRDEARYRCNDRTGHSHGYGSLRSSAWCQGTGARAAVLGWRLGHLGVSRCPTLTALGASDVCGSEFRAIPRSRAIRFPRVTLGFGVSRRLGAASDALASQPIRFSEALGLNGPGWIRTSDLGIKSSAQAALRRRVRFSGRCSVSRRYAGIPGSGIRLGIRER
jgi:hypothetical protein